jgi:hypothetical protein
MRRQMKDVPPFETGLPWAKWMVTNERDGTSPLDKIIRDGRRRADAKAAEKAKAKAEESK